MQLLPKALQHVIDSAVGTGAAPSPVRIVLNNINAGTTNVVFNSYQDTGSVPHFTLDPYREEVWQHIGLDMSAVNVSNTPMEPHRIGNTIWVNVMKTKDLDSPESFWVGQQVAALADEIGCVDHVLAFPSEYSAEYRTSQLSLGLWRTFEGICGAAHVPHTAANGPGAMDLLGFHEGLLSFPTNSYESVVIASDDVEEIVIETEEFTATIVVEEPTISEETPVSVLGTFPGRKVQLGSGGKAVQAIRDAHRLGKGKFDEGLLTVVLAAQEAAGITADGIVDSETWDAIDAALKGEE